MLAAATGLFLGLSNVARAQAPRDPSPDLLALSVGWYDALHDTASATQFRGEWRSGKGIWKVRPLIGVMGTTDGAYHGYAGILVDFQLGNFYITPSFAPGIYVRGNGKNIGGPVEFRSQIELGYRLPNRGRLAISVDHISNAGIYQRNPGVESAMLTYGIPLDLIFN
jgi:hypothetical protein